MYVTTLINVIKSFVYESKPQEKQELHLKLNFNRDAARHLTTSHCGTHLWPQSLQHLLSDGNTFPLKGQIINVLSTRCFVLLLL